MTQSYFQIISKNSELSFYHRKQQTNQFEIAPCIKISMKLTN